MLADKNNTAKEQVTPVSVQWRDVTYTRIFEQEIRGLERRMKADPLCTCADLEGILRNLYITEGADWEGRGDLQDTIISATIAAYEYFITELKKGS